MDHSKELDTKDIGRLAKRKLNTIWSWRSIHANIIRHQYPTDTLADRILLVVRFIRYKNELTRRAAEVVARRMAARSGGHVFEHGGIHNVVAGPCDEFRYPGESIFRPTRIYASTMEFAKDWSQTDSGFLQIDAREGPPWPLEDNGKGSFLKWTKGQDPKNE